MENRNWLKKLFLRKKKAFTLIELLAIIVILAIIAVITVPIILNIIENAKKGAATNSAYGYKDAISKFYASKLSLDSTYNIPDGLHNKSDFDAMGVLVNGKEPASNSFLRTYKNMVTSGCLQFDEYKVEIVDGKVINAVKGECKTVNLVYTDVNENGKIDLADTVKIEDDEFYVLEEPYDGKVKLLAKYDLDANSRQVSSGYSEVAFASSKYWNGHLSDYSVDKFDGRYVYRNKNNEDTSNGIVSYIGNYKDYLVELGAYFVTDGRMMSYEDAKNTGCKWHQESSPTNSCPSFMGNQSFWLGSINSSEWVYYISRNNRYIYANEYYASWGIRPLIEIYESALTNNYTLTFDSRGGTEVASKTIVTGAKAGALPANPTKEGAVFEGWYTDKDYTSEKLTSETIPVGSTTYYARYVLTKAEYTDLGTTGINLGDTVKILDDYFYVISSPENGKVKLLPKYNLNTNSRQENGHNPAVAFSSSGSWSTSTYALDFYNRYYVYRNKDNQDTANNLKNYINNYKNYLNRQGAEFVTDARLMSYTDARATGCKWHGDSNSSGSCPSYVANQTYWIGSTTDNSSSSWIMYVDSSSNKFLYAAPYNSTNGVRPLIEINESALTDVYDIAFDSRGGTAVASRTIATGAPVGTLPEAPTKTGATFVGWYTDKEYTTQITADTVPVGSTTYYARYVLTKAEYTDLGTTGINLGDTVKILDDEFYVISSPDVNNKVKLLPKYNLNTSSRQENGHNPAVAFSSSGSWSTSTYALDGYNNYYVYRNKNNEDTANNLKNYINAYKSYLNAQGAEFVTDARLMSYTDAMSTGCKWHGDSNSSGSCPSYVANQTYWIGSTSGNSSSSWIMYVDSSSNKFLYAAPKDNAKGVRPLVEINVSALQ